MELDPIGIFHCKETYPYDAARQGTVSQDNSGYIELLPGKNYEQAIEDLEGFSHIWLIYQFHKNETWKPKVMPPRGDQKRGVFATRAPYRPNPIGMSCVRLGKIDGRKIEVFDHDLLDQTPILDIKPYLPYADSFPDATQGWLEDAAGETWLVEITDNASGQLEFLESRGIDTLRGFLNQQLSHEPTNTKKKRVTNLENTHWELSYRTWRIEFEVNEVETSLTIVRIYSGYSEEDIDDGKDPYKDKEIHRVYSVFYQT